MPHAPGAAPAAPLLDADNNSRRAAIALATALPCDVLLYLILPMYAASFGLTLAEVGILLAANRLVRVVGYGWVARFYARHGDRRTCLLAVLGAVCCAVGYSTLSGFWALLPLRLLWGMAFGALNLTTQALATAVPEGAAARYGRSRAYIALGPLIALPIGAVLTYAAGPRPIFVLLALLALSGLLAVRGLPKREPVAVAASRVRLRKPSALEAWSFLEGFTLDGLFLIGLTVLGKELMPDGAVLAAGLLLAARHGSEIVLSPLGGRLADQWGAEKLLVALSLTTCVALVGFGFGWLWSCAAAIVVLRALQLPLVAPIVAHRAPGAERVQALAALSVWRDIGAGIGPVVAGLALPVVPGAWLYGASAALLALAALACRR